MGKIRFKTVHMDVEHELWIINFTVFIMVMWWQY
jgi:hypothetical protein